MMLECALLYLRDAAFHLAAGLRCVPFLFEPSPDAVVAAPSMP
jgi:hypothetical protein